MAARVDDVTCYPASGGTIQEVTLDVTTMLGLQVQLRGSAATIATSRCVVTLGSQSVVLTTTHTTAGEVTASLTAANLVTLAAAQLSVLDCFWSGTITDGAVTHNWRYEQLLGVSDREFRFPIVYEDLERRFPLMKSSCTYPSGDSNWWPTIRISLDDLRIKINNQQGGSKTRLATNAADFKLVAVAKALWQVAESMDVQDFGQGSLDRWRKRFQEEFDREWKEAVAAMKLSGSAFETSASRSNLTLEAPTFLGGYGGYGGQGI